MFRPRHAYKSPITNRYRGKAKGCPVFNNLTDINSNMVEQHDECLECLAKIKNRTDLYKTLADNNKPSNNVIKSLQKLSSSASNNRLKTCLQFLIIKVNEKSTVTPQRQTTTADGTTTTTTINSSRSTSPKLVDTKEAIQPIEHTLVKQQQNNNNSNNKRPKLLYNQQQKQRQQQQKQKRQQQQQKLKQLASPPQDQVSSTQDQIGPTQDEHDCQTSPMMLITTHQLEDENNHDDHDDEIKIKQLQDSPTIIKHEEDQLNSTAQTQSSPSLNYASTTTTTLITTNPTTVMKASPSQTTIDMIDGSVASTTSVSSKTKQQRNINDSQQQASKNRQNSTTTTTTSPSKRRKIHNSSDHDTSSTASWSSSYAYPASPISTSSTSSISSSSSQTSSCSSSLSPSPSPLSSPDIINELRGPRLKLSEEKIRKIKKRPILFDDNYYTEHSFASTPTTSSGCSPGQHSNTTQNSDLSRSGLSSLNNTVIHMFQAPPKFVNNLKPCNLPTRPQEPSPTSTPPVQNKVEMLNCAICGIKARPPNINKVYGQNSCILCAEFFTRFLKCPRQLYCAQDGDCLMTFDSRCQACWIKICLQKFNIEDKHRKTGLEYSPKLLSSPNVSLITIDTSLSR